MPSDLARRVIRFCALQLAAAVQRIAGNDTGDTRRKAPSVLDWSTGLLV